MLSAISACEKGKEWQGALALLAMMGVVASETDVFNYNSAISACEKGTEWQRALAVFIPMDQVVIKPNTFSHNSAITACEYGPTGVGHPHYSPPWSALSMSQIPLGTTLRSAHVRRELVGAGRLRCLLP